MEQWLQQKRIPDNLKKKLNVDLTWAPESLILRASTRTAACPYVMWRDVTLFKRSSVAFNVAGESCVPFKAENSCHAGYTNKDGSACNNKNKIKLAQWGLQYNLNYWLQNSGLFSVPYSDFHLNTGLFDNRIQIYHTNTRQVRYLNGYCISYLILGTHSTKIFVGNENCESRAWWIPAQC